MAKAERRTVDLSSYPELVVIYLRQRINSPRGLWTAFKLGRPISKAVAANPDGLLRHETAIYDTMTKELGFSAFAPVEQARGRMFSARSRAGATGDETAEPVLSEEELYRK